MKKYIQLKDSYDSKKGDMWEQITIYGYTNKLSKIFIENTTIEKNPDWFAPYEEKKEYPLARIFKLLIDSPEYPKGTLAVFKAEYLEKNFYMPGTYVLFFPEHSIDHVKNRYGTLRKESIENREGIWELQQGRDM